MSGYDYEKRPNDPGSGPRPQYIAYDYGLYDEKTGKWWHADHCEGCGNEPMTIYESNLRSYSRRLADFDRQVFCVAVTESK
jgi:hypothetical protein